MLTRLRPILLLLLIPLLAQPSLLGQDWKSTYDKAVGLYQEQHYDSALLRAEKALTLSRTLPHLNQAYSIQLITAICIENQQIRQGLALINEEVSLFEQIEGKQGKSYDEASRKRVQLLQLDGQLEKAEMANAEVLAQREKVFGKESYEFCSSLLTSAALSVAQGKHELAREPLEVCLRRFPVFPDAGQEYLTALYLSGGVDMKLNNPAAAEKKFAAYLEIAPSDAGEELAQVKVLLSGVLIGKGEIDRMIRLVDDQRIPPDQRARLLLQAAIWCREHTQTENAGELLQLSEKNLRAASLRNGTLFSVLVNQASILIEKGELELATSRIQEASKLSAELFKSGGVEVAYLRVAEGDLLVAKGEYAQAEVKYRQAAEGLNGLPSTTRARASKDIGRKLFNSGRYPIAVSTLKPIATDPAVLGSLPESERVELIALYVEALLESFQSPLGVEYLQKLTGNWSLAATAQIGLLRAETLEVSGRWTEAVATLQEIIKNSTLGTRPLGDAFFQLARLEQRMAHYAEAEANYHKAIDIYGKVRGSEAALAQAYNSLATYYLTLGNYASAEELYETLLRQTDPKSAFYTTVLNNLAALYEETLRHDKAKLVLSESIKRDRDVLGPNHPSYAIGLQNLAIVYQKTGEPQKAREMLEEAMAIDERNEGKNSLSYAAKSANLASINADLGNLALARKQYEEALKTQRQILGPTHPDVAYNQFNLAVLLQRQHELDAAHLLFKDVSAYYLREIRELFPALSEVEKAAYYNKLSPVIDAYQDFAIEYSSSHKEIAGDLYNFRLATKALLLNASTKIRNRIVEGGDPAQISQFMEWQTAQERLARIYSLPLQEVKRRQSTIDELKKRSNELSKSLAAQSELFADEYDNSGVTWQQVKSAIKPGEAAVEMIRLRLNQRNDSIVYAALVLRPEFTLPQMIVLRDGKKLEGREYNYYRNLIRFQIENKRSHSIYWQPVEGALQNVRRLYLSPDGIYNKLSLATLYDPGANRYLLDHLSITLVSNTREIVRTKKGFSGEKTATLIGYPDFRMGAQINRDRLRAQDRSASDAIGQLAYRLDDLPATRTEVEQINQLLKGQNWKTQLLLGVESSEINVKAQVSPKLLHIATHGYFIDSPVSQGPLVQSSDPSRNPMLQSGLLLAGAQKYLYQRSLNEVIATGDQDGVLTALEAMTLNLDNTDLVVLSACETGSGQVRNGEGVYGLQRSFLVSGAASILMTLWKVDDESTEKLMTAFYRSWIQLGDKAEALHRTQMEIKAQYPDPYYWGAFVMMGK